MFPLKYASAYYYKRLYKKSQNLKKKDNTSYMNSNLCRYVLHNNISYCSLPLIKTKKMMMKFYSLNLNNIHKRSFSTAEEIKALDLLLEDTTPVAKEKLKVNHNFSIFIDNTENNFKGASALEYMKTVLCSGKSFNKTIFLETNSVNSFFNFCKDPQC